MLPIDALRLAVKSDDAELAAARAEHDRASAAVKGQGPLALFFDRDVRAANERIGCALRRLMDMRGAA